MLVQIQFYFLSKWSATSMSKFNWNQPAAELLTIERGHDLREIVQHCGEADLERHLSAGCNLESEKRNSDMIAVENVQANTVMLS